MNLILDWIWLVITRFFNFFAMSLLVWPGFRLCLGNCAAFYFLLLVLQIIALACDFFIYCLAIHKTNCIKSKSIGLSCAPFKLFHQNKIYNFFLKYETIRVNNSDSIITGFDPTWNTRTDLFIRFVKQIIFWIFFVFLLFSLEFTTGIIPFYGKYICFDGRRICIERVEKLYIPR